jgi:hypothetical protein
METDLSGRIRDWEARVKPMLDEEATRRQFDIHGYGRTVLGQIPTSQKGAKGNAVCRLPNALRRLRCACGRREWCKNG